MLLFQLLQVLVFRLSLLQVLFYVLPLLLLWRLILPPLTIPLLLSVLLLFALLLLWLHLLLLSTLSAFYRQDEDVTFALPAAFLVFSPNFLGIGMSDSKFRRIDTPRKWSRIFTYSEAR